jgi:hypothetical protein
VVVESRLHGALAIPGLAPSRQGADSCAGHFGMAAEFLRDPLRRSYRACRYPTESGPVGIRVRRRSRSVRRTPCGRHVRLIRRPSTASPRDRRCHRRRAPSRGQAAHDPRAAAAAPSSDRSRRPAANESRTPPPGLRRRCALRWILRASPPAVLPTSGRFPVRPGSRCRSRVW